MKKNILYVSICVLILPVFNIAAHSVPEVGRAKVMDKQHIYFVILAGGSGERLWPLSRQSKPKQLLAVGDEQSLLDQAISRVESLAPKEQIWVSTTAQHAASIEKEVGKRVGRVLAEPGSRNTGPAILYSCFEIYQKDPHAVIAFLPADPFIPTKDNNNFSQFLEHAIDFVSQNDSITLFGVKPTFPATGYGYIEFAAGDQMAPYQVKKFHEKPALDVAQKYIESGNMLWNVSIFCAKVSVFLEEFSKNAPEMFQGVQDFVNGKKGYETVKADSIDYAVMEKSKRVTVLPVDFAWWDVGNIEIFLSIKEKYGALDTEKIVSTESFNNLIDVPNKLVALIGVNDLCVVETDEVLLITKREDAEKVRAIVKSLKQGSLRNYL
jgi:mannose-1-phosphate guanylyltransferase